MRNRAPVVGRLVSFQAGAHRRGWKTRARCSAGGALQWREWEVDSHVVVCEETVSERRGVCLGGLPFPTHLGIMWAMWLLEYTYNKAVRTALDETGSYVLGNVYEY